MVLVVEPDEPTAAALVAALSGAQLRTSLDAARRDLDAGATDGVVLVGPSVDGDAALALSERLRVAHPAVGVVLVRRRVGSALLTDALRSGVREVVSDRDIPAVVDAVNRADELSRAMRSAQGDTSQTPPGERTGTLVTVFAAKGGCGKTTVATNLAAALADRGRREVCLVDLDLAFGDVAIALQLFPAHTLADAVPLGDGLDGAALQGLLTPHSPGLTTLVAPVEPGIAESIPAATIGTVLRLLKQQFQFVVVDSPPAFTDQVLAAFDESDMVALLATLDIPALKNLKLTLETLDLLNYPREKWRVVLNRADSKVGLSLAEVETTLRVKIAVQIPSSRAVPASVNRGVPIVLDDPAHPVSEAIREFAETQVVPLSQGALGAAAIPTSVRTDRRGLLRRRTST
jgi:pilus assembly protein CpaE